MRKSTKGAGVALAAAIAIAAVVTGPAGASDDGRAEAAGQPWTEFSVVITGDSVTPTPKVCASSEECLNGFAVEGSVSGDVVGRVAAVAVERPSSPEREQVTRSQLTLFELDDSPCGRGSFAVQTAAADFRLLPGSDGNAIPLTVDATGAPARGVIVPGSGTGDLAAVRGTVEIQSVDVAHGGVTTALARVRCEPAAGEAGGEAAGHDGRPPGAGQD